MNWRLWATQLAAIIRLEMRKTFFSRRGSPVYLVALLPVLMYGGHSLVMILRGRPCNLGEDTHILAMVYQFLFLRLFIFFGCVAVFTNLFRGEILEKSLHFYMLAPVRREVLVVGKYLSGAIATSVIFGLSVILQHIALFWHLDGNAVSNYLYQSGGLGHIAAYTLVAMLACLGYGSIFLALGMVVRNPIVPAAAVLIWESVSSILPASLQRFTVIHYLQSLAPVPANPPKDAIPLQILFFVAERTPAPLAIFGLLALVAAILTFAALRARRLEIDYAAE